METKDIFIILGIIILIMIGCFYAYLYELSKMWVLHKPDNSPYFVTTKPIIIKNILLPKGTKITYNKHYCWEKHKQNKLLNEKDITEISFKEGITINWGGVPITSVHKFFNPEMKGFTVYADFNRLNKNKETLFSNLWQRGGNDLDITVKNTNDWSFNKENISDIDSCGVNYQRFFKEDIKQQRFLDDLYNELKKI